MGLILSSIVIFFQYYIAFLYHFLQIAQLSLYHSVIITQIQNIISEMFHHSFIFSFFSIEKIAEIFYNNNAYISF